MNWIYMAEAYDSESSIPLGYYTSLADAKRRCEIYNSTIFEERLITEIILDKDIDPLTMKDKHYWRFENKQWVEYLGATKIEDKTYKVGNRIIFNFDGKQWTRKIIKITPNNKSFLVNFAEGIVGSMDGHWVNEQDIIRNEET